MVKRSVQKKVKKIIDEWRAEGWEILPNGLPVHPEYVYRITGDWKGWSDFLGHKNQENDIQDIVEDAAFALIFK